LRATAFCSHTGSESAALGPAWHQCHPSSTPKPSNPNSSSEQIILLPLLVVVVVVVMVVGRPLAHPQLQTVPHFVHESGVHCRCCWPHHSLKQLAAAMTQCYWKNNPCVLCHEFTSSFNCRLVDAALVHGEAESIWVRVPFKRLCGYICTRVVAAASNLSTQNLSKQQKDGAECK
jgi:hypothetical protein